jgi:hypothetical protein
MTVEELRKKLEGIDPKMPVVIVRETEGDSEWYEVSDVSSQRGTPSRDDSGRVGFTYGPGPETWLFIVAEEG